MNLRNRVKQLEAKIRTRVKDVPPWKEVIKAHERIAARARARLAGSPVDERTLRRTRRC
jgi:hypothetical protein